MEKLFGGQSNCSDLLFPMGRKALAFSPLPGRSSTGRIKDLGLSPREECKSDINPNATRSDMSFVSALHQNQKRDGLEFRCRVSQDFVFRYVNFPVRSR
uniref:Uncharacterized protein n=1 Tax=Candidatus Kentrum sp. LFY TaxID=2126342 RepID=A0A450WLY5_9GAMM|nr:MAG: hypothetical protein BECKLFY1418C_GA0070996_103816 [Candidatus Kentron sp. LFY]